MNNNIVSLHKEILKSKVGIFISDPVEENRFYDFIYRRFAGKTSLIEHKDFYVCDFCLRELHFYIGGLVDFEIFTIYIEPLYRPSITKDGMLCFKNYEAIRQRKVWCGEKFTIIKFNTIPHPFYITIT